MWRKVIFLVVLLSAQLAAYACIHPPKGFPGQLTEREKAAFLFHDGKNAHLVIRTKIASNGELPDKMAWVIPVPALPSKFEEVPDELFDELARLIPRVRRRPATETVGLAKGAATAKKAEAPRIRVHDVQAVGDYRIQPIEILDETAARELNAWLTKNGFEPVSQHDQQYYLKKGAVFLTVRADGLKGTESSLKPLHIVYPDDRMRLPLKFSGHSGVFDVRLYVLTEQPPSRKALENYGLEVRDASYKIQDSLADRAPVVGKLVGERPGYVTEFTGRDYNAARSVTALSEDPWLTPAGKARGGEPGGPDHAGVMPAYPLLSVGLSPGGPTLPATGEAKAMLVFMTAWLVGALWLFGRNARHVAGALRGREPHRWRRVGNRSMVAGLALCLLTIPTWLLTMAFEIWGVLAEESPWMLIYAGLALFAIGLVARIAAIWADPEPAT